MVVVVNKRSCEGRGSEKWESIKQVMKDKLGSADIVFVDELKTNSIKKYILMDETEFVAAGGDGTVNHLLNDIIKSANGRLKNIKIGAIGIGSSNDFHKPFNEDNKVNGIYCKTDFHNIIKHDLCKLSFEDKNGKNVTKYFIINAGIGITAEANNLFNRPDAMLKFLKRKNTIAAIFYAALKTILTWKNKELTLTVDTESRELKVTNLGIVKNPNFSGNFCYDSIYKPCSGKYNIHLCENMSLIRTLGILFRLNRKKFTGYNSTSSFESDNITVTSRENFTVEFDGEVIETRRAQFTIIPSAINLCK